MIRHRAPPAPDQRSTVLLQIYLSALTDVARVEGALEETGAVLDCGLALLDVFQRGVGKIVPCDAVGVVEVPAVRDFALVDLTHGIVEDVGVLGKSRLFRCGPASYLATDSHTDATVAQLDVDLMESLPWTRERKKSLKQEVSAWTR